MATSNERIEAIAKEIISELDEHARGIDDASMGLPVYGDSRSEMVVMVMKHLLLIRDETYSKCREQAVSLALRREGQQEIDNGQANTGGAKEAAWDISKMNLLGDK